MTDLQPDVKQMVFAARNGQFGEFFNRLTDDKALAFVLLILREHSQQILKLGDLDTAENDAATPVMSDEDAYDAILELYARGFIKLTEREDGSIVAEMTTPQETAADGRPMMANTPSIN